MPETVVDLGAPGTVSDLVGQGPPGAATKRPILVLLAPLQRRSKGGDRTRGARCKAAPRAGPTLRFQALKPEGRYFQPE